MRKRVKCAVCGKEKTITINLDGSNDSGWEYFGRINVNACKTDKYLYEIPDSLDIEVKKWKKVRNPHYDPKAKPNYVEYWECRSCLMKCMRKLKNVVQREVR